ncbi:hypothetical protein IYY11_21330 [Methylocystis sp. H62]|uniref:hypothetical protein n=1 Tax=Methylocystis sp. H62 TaxID=2785789 RepID=UPI0018C343B3|nr:hypothetical protein [Methylocystis sp. H62]MBG0795904.1 hypothetical protein [Methylocystis sp. H62]
MNETHETQETEAPKNRMQVLGHERPSKKKPLTALDAKAKLLIEYQISGCPHAYVSQYTRAAPTEFDPDARRPLEPGEPLKLEEAADLLRTRRRHARWIMAQPIAQKELALQLQAMRDGHRAEALNTVVAVMRDRGDGKAADKKVRIQAASMILGDAVGQTPAKSNVQVNVGVNLTAGIVIRLPSNLPQTPLESGVEPKSIVDTHPLSREQRMLTRVESNEAADD